MLGRREALEVQTTTAGIPETRDPHWKSQIIRLEDQMSLNETYAAANVSHSSTAA